MTEELQRARQLVEEGHTLLPAADPDAEEQGFVVVHMDGDEESSEIVRLSRDELQRLQAEFDALHGVQTA